MTDPRGTCFGWEACEDAADTAWDNTAGRLDWGDAGDLAFAIKDLGGAAAGALAFGGVATGCAGASWATAGIATPFWLVRASSAWLVRPA